MDTGLSDELKAALREKIANIGVTQQFAGQPLPTTSNFNDEECDAIFAALQPEIERLVVEARIDEVNKVIRALERPPRGIDTGLMNIGLIEYYLRGRIAQFTQQSQPCQISLASIRPAGCTCQCMNCHEQSAHSRCSRKRDGKCNQPSEAI